MDFSLFFNMGLGEGWTERALDPKPGRNLGSWGSLERLSPMPPARGPQPCGAGRVAAAADRCLYFL